MQLNYDVNNFCGLLSNIGIQESAVRQSGDQFKLSKTALYSRPDALLTSVAMAIQNRERIAVLGTNTGQVSKVTNIVAMILKFPATCNK